MHKPHLEPLTPEIRARLENPEALPRIIKKYSSWTVYLLDHDQAQPGRMCAWYKRHVDHMETFHLTYAEIDDFHHGLLPTLTRALEALGPLAWVSSSWPGDTNEEHRGHGRYCITPHYTEPLKLEESEILALLRAAM